MRLAMTWVTVVLAWALPFQALAASKIGDWEVDKAKACAISASWTTDDGIGMGLVMGYLLKGEYFVIAMIASDTKYRPNETFRVKVEVDDVFKATVDGSAADERTAIAVLPATARLIDALITGDELFMEVIGKPDNYAGTYALEDTDRAIPALDSCRATTE